MKPPMQKHLGDAPKKSLVVAYQHQYAEDYAASASPLMGAEAAIAVDLSLDRVFSQEETAFIESIIGDDMSRSGLVVLITSEKDWNSSESELLLNLSKQGFNTISIVCGASAGLSVPYLDQTTDRAKGVFIIRTEQSWLRRVLGDILWAYGKPLGVITLNINDLVDAVLPLYPRHTDAHALCHAHFEHEIGVFTHRVATDTAAWGKARYVFISITSTDITVEQLEHIGSLLRNHFPPDTKFGIQIGTDERCADGAMQLAALVFFMPQHTDRTLSRSQH